MLPWAVCTDGHKTTSQLEELEGVSDVLYICAVLKGRIHHNAVKQTEVCGRAA